MVRRKLTFAERLQYVEMSKAEFSNRKVAGKMEVHQFAIDRLMQRLQSTGIVDDRPRCGKPRKT
jgi:IS30 family transposase